MNVTVLLFAQPRDIVGQGRIVVAVEEGSTPETVFAAVSAQAPGLAPLRADLRVAVDDAYCAWDAALKDGAELAFIPPTAGG